MLRLFLCPSYCDVDLARHRDSSYHAYTWPSLLAMDYVQDGNTALHLAAEYGNDKCVDALLAKMSETEVGREAIGYQNNVRHPSFFVSLS